MSAHNLVIVESPAKAKTIQKFLGKEYVVMSSQGHIRELVDKEKEFLHLSSKTYSPSYEVIADKDKLVLSLRKAAKEANLVYLASDEDREGEAIAWHLMEVLQLDKTRTRRIAFHEITKTAIEEAIKHPRNIDMNLVNAQQARRVLDRVVGFELSPVLWRKVKPRLSAGRVQSVTVRLIVDREREIRNFKPERYYRVTAEFVTPEGEIVEGVLETRLKTRQEVTTFLEACKTANFSINSIKKEPIKRTPAPPFTTSTLQQEAARKLGFSVSTTMRIAQGLYESGKITYMRTDSVNLSTLALNSAKNAIVDMAGEIYYKRRQYATKSKGAQEAHEAIRPTFIDVEEAGSTKQEKNLYNLIWKRTIASQMADAQIEKTTVNIAAKGLEYNFVATGEVITFDGFLKVYMESTDDAQPQDTILLPTLKEGETIGMEEATAREKFTQHPARYTEASLVRKLEELGIGRPSTYAPTISTIQERDYVQKREVTTEAPAIEVISLKDDKISTAEMKAKDVVEKGKLTPTDIGMVTNDYLMEHFPNIMDFNFTSEVEQQFDNIAEGGDDWHDNIADFYNRFHPSVTKAIDIEGRATGERILGTDPKTGKVVLVRLGQYGSMAQIGAMDDEDKVFAKLKPDQLLESITLEEALELFKLPLKLGEYEGQSLTVSVGRFGPYVRHGQSFISVPKGEDPLMITHERAIEIIEAKREADLKKIMKVFEADGITIINGRFGPYISYNNGNYKIAKSVDAMSLTLEDCKKIIADIDAAGGPKTSARKKAAKTTKVAKTKSTKSATKTKAATKKATKKA